MDFNRIISGFIPKGGEIRLYETLATLLLPVAKGANSYQYTVLGIGTMKSGYMHTYKQGDKATIINLSSTSFTEQRFHLCFLRIS